MLLALDAIDTRANVELEILGGVPWNGALAIDSIRRLVWLAKPRLPRFCPATSRTVGARQSALRIVTVEYPGGRRGEAAKNLT